MNKPQKIALALAMILVGVVIYTQWYAARTRVSSPSQHPESIGDERPSHGNTVIKRFYQAKKKAHELYQGMESTFYCGCSFTGKLVDHHSCGFKPIHEDERSYRIEWEHVVPASDFGRSFKAWREGHPDCVNAKGKKFRGRRCARKVSDEFNLMESDLYNLVPAIGEVNNRRANLPMGLIGEKGLSFGHCKTKISATVVEPRDEVKGFIARTYQYMNHAYPGHGIISRKNKKLFEAWDRSYPPSQLEVKRAKRIAIIQGNLNPFIEQKSKLDSKQEATAD